MELKNLGSALEEIPLAPRKTAEQKALQKRVEGLYKRISQLPKEETEDAITLCIQYENELQDILEEPLRPFEKRLLLTSFYKAVDKLESRLSKLNPRKSRQNAIEHVTSRSRSHNLTKSRRNHLLNVYRHGTPLMNMDKPIVKRFKSLVRDSKVYNMARSQKNRSNRR